MEAIKFYIFNALYLRKYFNFSIQYILFHNTDSCKKIRFYFSISKFKTNKITCVEFLKKCAFPTSLQNYFPLIQWLV